MSQEKLQQLIETMEPQEALQAIAQVVRICFPFWAKRPGRILSSP